MTYPTSSFPAPGPSNLPASTAPRPQWQRAAIAVTSFVVGLYVLEFVDMLLGNSLDNGGIEPRTVDGLWGVLFAPVLHGGWGHLVANTIPLLVLGFFVMLSGIGRGLTATAIIWIVGGVGTWLTGGSGTTHLGASVLTFGWLTYLITRGLFTRHFGQLALGVVILFLYGGMLWGVLPSDPRVSWQGHLFGAIGGVLAAWLLASDVRAARAAKQLPG
ncbi:rhomboid family intramembrane serine protease [Rhodococcus sp. NPDC003318]|uniref:rhomboid family intramembrane serine protease n=1 Tax=Rhodococcus sp. NPDC003318 TaxID=3364503 RepID=UPI00369F1622